MIVLFYKRPKQAELSGAKILLVVDSREEQESEIVIVADRFLNFQKLNFNYLQKKR